MPRSPSLEDHLAAIEAAVDALEGGDLPLDEALARYESGLKAVRAAQQQLAKYQARLDELRAEPPAEPPAGAPG